MDSVAGSEDTLLDGPVAVNYSCEEVRLYGNVTLELERYLLSQQANQGKTMVGFEFISGNTLNITFEQIKHTTRECEKALMEGRITFEQLTERLTVSPWVIYYFQDLHPDLYIEPGEKFFTLRPIADYAAYLSVDDPVQLVDIRTGKCIGSGRVTSVTTIRLRDVALDQMKQKGLMGSRHNTATVKKVLRNVYEEEFNDDSVLSLIVMVADNAIGTPPPANNSGLLSRLLNKVGIGR